MYEKWKYQDVSQILKSGKTGHIMLSFSNIASISLDAEIVAKPYVEFYEDYNLYLIK